MVTTSVEGEQQVRNEVNDYVDLRSFGSVEAAWHLFSFPISRNSPSVMALRVHLPEEQTVTFTDHNMQQVLNSQRKTELTEFFTFNQSQLESGVPKQSLPTYVDMPDQHRYDIPRKCWIKRKQHQKEPTIGRLPSIHPMAGDLFYLRMLLHSSHCKGSTSFNSLLLDNDGLECATYKEVCLRIGLLSDDTEWEAVLEDATGSQMCPQVRQLFVTICIFCEVSNPTSLFERFWPDWGDDIVLKHSRLGQTISQDQLRILVLLDLEVRLQSFEKSLQSLGLPTPSPLELSWVAHLVNPAPTIIREELDFDVGSLAQEVERVVPMLTDEQQVLFNDILDATQHHRQILAFLDARGGCGKTFLLNAILDAVRSSEQGGCIALAMATTGLAATLLHKGRTFHSRMKPPKDLTDSSTLNINHQSALAKLVRDARLLLIDEATMLDEFLFSALDRTLRDLTNMSGLPFGGKSLLLSGDFKQCLPVVPGASRAGIVRRCINKSLLWRHFTVYRLSVNLRLAQSNTALLHGFDRWTLSIGEGTKDRVNIPRRYYWDINPSQRVEDEQVRFFRHIFPDLQHNLGSIDWIKGRSILVPTNKDVDAFNLIASREIPGDGIDLLSADSVTDETDALRFNTEFLNSLNPHGFASHSITVKPGMPLTLLRNLSPGTGLCNGTRLIFRRMRGNHLLECTLMENGDTTFIPRIQFIPNEGDFSFEWRRRQFPVRPSFAMTINKSQGQTLQKVGLWLRSEVFTHGQLYVAVSRVRHPSDLTIAVSTEPGKRPKCDNVVFGEVLSL